MRKGRSLREIAPKGCSIVWSRRARGLEVLFPEEARYVSGACQKRIRDFAMGRYCARVAMEELGMRGEPIPSTASRAPYWPEGVVGSISHTAGFAAALLGSARDYASLGLDCQQVEHGRISSGMAKLILAPGEDEHLQETRQFEDMSREELLTLVFSAKEALYKCLNPLVKKFFGFHCAEIICIDSRDGSFRIRLSQSLSKDFQEGHEMQGKFCLLEDVLSVSLALAAR